MDIMKVLDMKSQFISWFNVVFSVETIGGSSIGSILVDLMNQLKSFGSISLDSLETSEWVWFFETASSGSIAWDIFQYIHRIQWNWSIGRWFQKIDTFHWILNEIYPLESNMDSLKWVYLRVPARVHCWQCWIMKNVFGPPQYLFNNIVKVFVYDVVT